MNMLRFVFLFVPVSMQFNLSSQKFKDKGSESLAVGLMQAI